MLVSYSGFNSTRMEIDAWFEKQYTASMWSKKHKTREECIANFIEDCCNESTKAKEECARDEIDVKYGSAYDLEKVDFVYAFKENKINDKRPVFVYIHGGYWQEGNKEMYFCIGQSFANAGWDCAIIGYELCPRVTIADIKLEIVKALRMIRDKFGDRSLIVCGHSAGAYLAAYAAQASHQLDIDRLVLLSGVYDVTPLLKTTFNNALKLTTEQADALNLLTHQSALQAGEIIVVCGEQESDEFKRQSKDYFNHVARQHQNIYHRVLKDEDHFSEVLNLLKNHSEIKRLIIDLY